MTEEEKREAAKIEALGSSSLEKELTASLYGSEETGRLMEFCETIEKAVASIDKALKQSKRGEAVLKSMKSYSSLASGSKAQGSATQAASAKTGEENKKSSLASMSDEELQKKYVEWAKETNYGYYDWSMPAIEGQVVAPSLAYKHAYSADAVGMSSTNTRNTVLMKEVSTVCRMAISDGADQVRTAAC